MCKHMDAALIVKMRNMLPEFIALWKAADLLDGTKPNGLGLMALPDLLRAVEELNRKADDELAQPVVQAGRCRYYLGPACFSSPAATPLNSGR